MTVRRIFNEIQELPYKMTVSLTFIDCPSSFPFIIQVSVLEVTLIRNVLKVLPP